MRSITFAVSKGGVGKSLMTANVAAALAEKGKKVTLVEGDPNRPLQTILGVEVPSGGFKLDEIVKKDVEIEKATYATRFDDLFLIPSGVSLKQYFEMNPIEFVRKLSGLKTDYMFVDVPFPLGEAAFLSLGLCEYFIIILTEDEFVLCVESAIDTIRLGRYFLKSVPLGFVLNRIKTPSRFSEEFAKDLENLLEIPCISRVKEDPRVSKSYGGVGSKKAFLAYERFRGDQFGKEIDRIAAFILGELPKPEKEDPVKLIEEVIKPLRL